MKVALIFLLLVALLSGCFPPPTPAEIGVPTPTVAPTVTATSTVIPPTPGNLPDSAACDLLPIVAPTRPAVVPGYAQLDETTGLHMTGVWQEIDLASYRLQITGKVDYPISLTYDQLRCLPKVSAEPVLICDGYFEDVADWSGVPLKYLLRLAGMQADAESVLLISQDGYEAYLTLEEALRDGNFVAYEWEGQPLPILHGFPVRAVIPSMFGNKWAKWLVEIRVE